MTRLQQLSRPVAIAMWDFSWLLRHHRTGEFEDWDRVLAGLCERGYNAVRIDAFPHLTAEPVAGTPAPEEYLCRKEFRGADTWGNRYSTRIRPRAALLEFLGRCRAHGVAVGLSTWWLGHGIERQDPLAGPDDFVRAWDETLQVIERHGLMDVLLYVDILNEYPRWHGWNWFHEQGRQRDQAAQTPADPVAGPARPPVPGLGLGQGMRQHLRGPGPQARIPLHLHFELHAPAVPRCLE